MRQLPAVTRLGPLEWTSPLPGHVAENMNGATLFRVPDRVAGRLGRYYLYFAHHEGQYIRMAHADAITGPWTLHAGGVLHRDACPWVATHIASPDLRIEEDGRIVMYFHGDMTEPRGQFTFRAESTDGLSFTPAPDRLGTFYFRNFEHGDIVYALGKARIYRSIDGGRSFEHGPLVYPLSPETPGQIGHQALRHSAVLVEGDLAHVVFSRIGDAPEALRYGTMALTGPWHDWLIEDHGVILSPDADFEGGNMPVVASRLGKIMEFQRALRDPHLLRDGGKTYLAYSFGGEAGLALAEIDL